MDHKLIDIQTSDGHSISIVDGTLRSSKVIMRLVKEAKAKKESEIEVDIDYGLMKKILDWTIVHAYGQQADPDIPGINRKYEAKRMENSFFKIDVQDLSELRNGAKKLEMDELLEAIDVEIKARVDAAEIAQLKKVYRNATRHGIR